ncbi:MAG: hypothetical protein HFJ12_07255 [Bacilli bacterium]|nr:hypothetical protein [Bacilli bacterium]
MYIDLVVFIILLILVVMFFKRFSSFIFFIAIFDILLRILTFVKNNINLPDVSALIGKYIPSGVLGIIEKYSNGIITVILSWIYVIIMAIFLCYICKIFFKKKKI